MFSVFFSFFKSGRLILRWWVFKRSFHVLVCFFSSFFICFAYAEKVNQVLIKGNKIIDEELIRSHIQMKNNSDYSEKTIQEDVRHLFSFGFFDDIEVRKSYKRGRLNLIYEFKERIHIGAVEFVGNKKIGAETLKELLLLREYDFLNLDQLRNSLSAIKAKYIEKSYYFVEVSYRTEKSLSKKELKLIIDIKENKPLIVKKIRLIGNRNISFKNLKMFMQTKEQNIFSFLGGSGQYKPEFIERDRQLIEYYYRDKGYLNINVARPEVTISPDKRFLHITFTVSEGPRFKMGEVAFREDKKEFQSEGYLVKPGEKNMGLAYPGTIRKDSIFSEDEVLNLLDLKKGIYFSLSRLQRDIEVISSLYKNRGYAFVKVNPLFYPDQMEEDKIHILFKAEKGDLYTVSQTHIINNHNTRDKVISRFFRIRDGDIYNERQKEATSQLIKRLGYFEEVNIALKPKGNKKKELDLIVDVKERESMGQATLSGGYNGAYGIFIEGGLSRQNFLGLGHSASLSLTLSLDHERFDFKYSIPYIFDSSWNGEFRLFNAIHNSANSVNPFDALFSRGQYYSLSEIGKGFSTLLGRNLTDFFSLSLRYELKYQNLTGEDSTYFFRPVASEVSNFLFGKRKRNDNDPEFSEEENYWDRPFQRQYFFDIYDPHESTGLNSSLELIADYDRRDDPYYAKKGFWLKFSTQYSGLGGDFDYIKAQGQFRHYYSPFWKLVIKSRLDYGLIFSSNRKKGIPDNELFILGGPYNLRGFQLRTQSPRKFSQNAFNYAQDYNTKNERAKAELPKDKEELLALKDQDAPKEDIQKKEDLIVRKTLWANLEPFYDPLKFAERPYGASQMIFYSLELEIPIIERAELRGAVFFDIGEANNNLKLNLKDQLRANMGFGIRWKSPFGLINLDWAFPYEPRKEFEEKNMKFQLSFGTAF